MILSKDVSQMLRQIINPSTELTVIDKKLEVRKSTLDGSGEGLFALERIPKGTIFISAGDINNYDTISRKINDLAYRGSVEKYDIDENVLAHINIGYVVKMDQLCMFFGPTVGTHEIYLCAIDDIEEGQELSRFYGLEYWENFEFWNRFPESKYLQTKKIEDLPSEYVYIDSVRKSLEMNFNYSLFCKKDDQGYHYLTGFGNNYFKKGFFNSGNFIDVSKSDFSQYELEESIKTEHGNMHTTKYLQYLKIKET